MAFDLAFDALVIPFLVALVGMVIAIIERGWKRYQDEKIVNPNITFGVAYIMNMLLTAGGVGTLLAIITAIIAMLQAGETSTELTLFAMIGQFGAGYLLGYRVLDAFNNRTEKKIEASTGTVAPQPSG